MLIAYHMNGTQMMVRKFNETLKRDFVTKNDFAVISSCSDFYWLRAKGFESLNAFDSSTQCDCVCFFLYIYI